MTHKEKMNNNQPISSSRKNRLFPLYRRPSLYYIPDQSSVYVGVFPKSCAINNHIIQENSNTLYTRLIETLSNVEENDCIPEFPETEEKSGNIILDMDGTLGDNIPSTFQKIPNDFARQSRYPDRD